MNIDDPNNYVVTSTGCHHWVRSTTHDGYAHAQIDGRLRYIHRVIWERANGPLAEGMTVDHTCFNASCINLAHLRELDFMTNSRLQRSAFKASCVNGHPFDAANTYRRPGDNRRQCKTCKRAATQRWRARKAVA